MRPQDIAILLKIIAIGKMDWQLAGLSHVMSISLSEISESLNRSRIAGLIDFKKKKISRQNLLEFLEYGVKYVFPAAPGSMAKGVATAHSHPFMKQHFQSEENFVWSDPSGEIIGLALEPFYPNQVKAIKNDAVFYKLLALVDVVRAGRMREKKIALQELHKMILNEK